MDRPLQNISDIDESKIVEVYDNLVWYKLPLDNGWTSYTLRALDCMHDNVEIYNKDNIYSDDGYTLGVNFSLIFWREASGFNHWRNSPRLVSSLELAFLPLPPLWYFTNYLCYNS